MRSSTGRLIPLDTVADGDDRRRTAVRQPHRPAAVGDDLVQPEAGRRARRRGRRDSAAPRRRCRPPSSTNFQGTAQAFQDSLQGLGLILLMAIVVIYIVLGVLYESFTHPLTILSGLPSAGFGALLTLLIFKTELSLYAFVGVIMLVGLVKKNGIMMVDFAIAAQREHGKAPLDAIHEACLVRFRPIMMTTMAALVGTLPIALGLGRRRRIAPSARPRRGRRAARLAAADALHHAGVLRVYRGHAAAAVLRAPPPDRAGGRSDGTGRLT